MALQDLLDVSSSHKKVGLSEERVMAIVPVARDYISFWREYPDIFIDFLVRGTRTEVKDGEFKFYFYQRIFWYGRKYNMENTVRSACHSVRGMSGFAVSQHLRPSGDPVSDTYHNLSVHPEGQCLFVFPESLQK